MKIHVVAFTDARFEATDSCLVVPVYKDELPFASAALRADDVPLLEALSDREVFTGAPRQLYYLPTPASPYGGLMLIGLGARDKAAAETLRRAGGSAVKHFKQNRVRHVYLDAGNIDLAPEAFFEGIVFGQYDFDLYKEKKADCPPPVKVESLTVLAGDGADLNKLQETLELAALLAVAANGARHLANTPPNDMTPSTLAAFAEGIAKDGSCQCTVLDEKQLASLGMNALLGVSKGSGEPAKLIILQYKHEEAAKTVALVGKGVTFDSGGISIKPAQSMHEMKFDMCGAAAVLCAMMAITQIKPKINLIVAVPSTENMTGDFAQKPGDIVKAYNGKTIEVLNTDAEGRLILADALSFVIDKYKPDALIDIATLTGAVLVALGHYAAGVLGNDDELYESIKRAGDTCGERVWQLPLWDDYRELVKGVHADIANIGPPREAGTILGAAFIEHFVGDTKWAHLDIAGTAWGGKNISYWNPNHATGWGVRLLTHWVLQQAE